MMRTKYLLIFAVWFCMPLFSKGISKCDSLRVTGDVSHYVFKDTADNECTFAALKGKYVFLDIWSMSCGPCLREMAYLETIVDKYKDKPIHFISICVENNIALWKKFLKQKGMKGVHWITPLFSPFLKENGFIGVPRFVLLDKNGCIMWRNAKRPSDADLQKELDLLFK